MDVFSYTTMTAAAGVTGDTIITIEGTAAETGITDEIHGIEVRPYNHGLVYSRDTIRLSAPRE